MDDTPGNFSWLPTGPQTLKQLREYITGRHYQVIQFSPDGGEPTPGYINGPGWLVVKPIGLKLSADERSIILDDADSNGDFDLTLPIGGEAKIAFDHGIVCHQAGPNGLVTRIVTLAR